MVSSKSENPIYNIRLSSVGPGQISGHATYEPTNMDLAMKLHYLRGVYYFRAQAFEGLSIANIKEPTFTWLNDYYMTCGRFRRDDSGRPYVKCNDCGIRFIEAQCDFTLEEWLEMRDATLEKRLVSDHVIGPEMSFSPPVLMQFTYFKCGGVSLGLSWAHVLGDAFTAAEFINGYGKVMAGHKPSLPINLSQPKVHTPLSKSSGKASGDPISIKRVDPVQDHWVVPLPTGSKMEAFTFRLNPSQLNHLQNEITGRGVSDLGTFDAICALIWRSVARLNARPGSDPRAVTVCRKDWKTMKDGVIGNTQVISVVSAGDEFRVSEAELSDLAGLIKNAGVDERRKIEEAVEGGGGVGDFVVYGANLTFIDFQDAELLYGLEFQGEKPVGVSYFVDGAGEEGVVLVLPGGMSEEEGRIVSVVMDEKQGMELKTELEKNGLIS